MPIPPANSTAETLRVLLIDDDEDEFVLVRDMLQEVAGHHYAIDWCHDYARAESTIIDGRHDAYLIDYRLGARTGIELIRKIRKRRLVRAMIMLTGQGDLKVDADAERAGASDYLIKSEINSALLDRSIRYSVASRRSEERLRHQAQLLQNVHDAVFLTSPDGTIVTWNPGATRVYGFSEEEMIGSNVSRVFPGGEEDRFSARVYPAVCRDGTCEFVAKSIRSDSSEIYVAVRAAAYKDPTFAGTAVLICANDITVRKQLEQRTLEISEREQQRIGQDIHDDLCQHLAGIGCLAKVLEKQLADVHAPGADGLARLGRMVADANVRARGIARGLVPSIIENLGLRGALEELAAQSRVVYGIECVLLPARGSAAEVPGNLAVQLFRIAQEAAGNAVRHGSATRVEFSLRVCDDAVRLVIRDDGDGMDAATAGAGERGAGLGLMSMRHRAEVLDGELTIGANAPTGVVVSVTVPRQS